MSMPFHSSLSDVAVKESATSAGAGKIPIFARKKNYLNFIFFRKGNDSSE